MAIPVHSNLLLYPQPDDIDAIVDKEFLSSNRYDGIITGDGTTTDFTITHNLGLKDVFIDIIDNVSDCSVLANVKRLNTTQIQISFGVAPAVGVQFRIIARI